MVIAISMGERIDQLEAEFTLVKKPQGYCS